MKLTKDLLIIRQYLTDKNINLLKFNNIIYIDKIYIDNNKFSLCSNSIKFINKVTIVNTIYKNLTLYFIKYDFEILDGDKLDVDKKEEIIKTFFLRKDAILKKIILFENGKALILFQSSEMRHHVMTNDSSLIEAEIRKLKIKSLLK